jgi:hypothetical protein
MNHSPRQIISSCLLGVFSCMTLCVPGAARAQVQLTIHQEDCSQGNTPCITIANQEGANVPQLNVEATPAFGPGQIAIVSAGGADFGLQDDAAVVRNEPYQAQAVTEMKQTLADGSHIVQTTTATIARDSDGRTVRVQKLNTIGPWRSADSSQGNNPTLTTIFDPVAKVHIDYTSDSKVAHVLTMPPLPAGPASGGEAGVAMSVSEFAPAPTGGVAHGFGVQTRAIPADVNNGEQPKTDSLGTKAIDGIQAVGTRTTSTIPPGAIGNDKALVITRETWYSPELQLVVESTQNDPRFGETSYTLKNIQQSAPDEALFQVPADYKVDKVVPRIIKTPMR